MREKLQKAMKEAMLAGNRHRLSTIRLIQAAIKDRDIAARGEEGSEGVSDAEILAILDKMIRQRRDSIRLYEEAGRLELAEQEREEIAIIEEFMPRRLSDDETRKAVEEAIGEVKAHSIRDMGKVMGVLKSRYRGQMDFSKAGAAVKQALG
ncbi:MAG: GatB/YqeY domain-containing protein [Alphaproteobacteria bacterium]|nr:MAG: GatB/YqeY domain-containing protein [Alphaproteobacteria bacterium]